MRVSRAWAHWFRGTSRQRRVLHRSLPRPLPRQGVGEQVLSGRTIPTP
jgi:hypothetical protein